MSIFTHPATFLTLELSVPGLAFFTRPDSPLRYAAAVLAVVLGIASCIGIHDRIENRSTKASVTASAVGNALTLIDRLLIAQYNYDAQGPEAYRHRHSSNGGPVKSKDDVKAYRSKPATSSFWFPLDPIFNTRGIRKPWQVKNVPTFSSKDPTYVPSRGRFLLRTLAFGALWLALHDFGVWQPFPMDHIITADKQGFFGRIREVTSEELLLRFVAVMFFWTRAMASLSLAVTYITFAAVALGIHEPRDWPPTFGSLNEAYSVRQFWGVFWHQYFRAMFEGIANSIAFSWLRLKRGTIIARYANIILVFFISGLLHIVSDYGQMVSPSDSGAMRFFLTQAGGIMAEDAFQALYYSASGKRRPQKAPLSHKIFGYLWLLVFLAWSTPVWNYPQMRTFRNTIDYMFPWNIYGHQFSSA